MSLGAVLTSAGVEATALLRIDEGQARAEEVVARLLGWGLVLWGEHYAAHGPGRDGMAVQGDLPSRGVEEQ